MIREIPLEGTSVRQTQFLAEFGQSPPPRNSLKYHTISRGPKVVKIMKLSRWLLASFNGKTSDISIIILIYIIYIYIIFYGHDSFILKGYQIDPLAQPHYLVMFRFSYLFCCWSIMLKPVFMTHPDIQPEAARYRCDNEAGWNKLEQKIQNVDFRAFFPKYDDRWHQQQNH